jgi:hypothetical protein
LQLKILDWIMGEFVTSIALFAMFLPALIQSVEYEPRSRDVREGPGNAPITLQKDKEI